MDFDETGQYHINWLSNLFLILNPDTNHFTYSSLSSSHNQLKSSNYNTPNQYTRNGFTSSPESNNTHIQQNYPFEKNYISSSSSPISPQQENNQQNYSMYNLNGDVTTLLPNNHQSSSRNVNQRSSTQCKNNNIITILVLLVVFINIIIDLLILLSL